MRRIFTTEQAFADGLTKEQLRWRVKSGACVDLGRGMYVEGSAPATMLELSIAGAIATGGAVAGFAAAALYGGLDLDLHGVEAPHFVVATTSSNKRAGARRVRLIGDVVTVDRVRVTDGTQTLIDLGALLDECRWEHALEAALRKKLTTIAELEAALVIVASRRAKGAGVIRRVLASSVPLSGGL